MSRTITLSDQEAAFLQSMLPELKNFDYGAAYSTVERAIIASIVTKIVSSPHVID